MKIFLDLMWFFKQEKKAYITGIIILAIVALLQLIPPKIVGIVVDSVAKGELTGRTLLMWLSILAIAGAAMYILRYFWRIMIFGSSVKLARLLRNQLYAHFSRMSSTFYQKYRTGDLMAHATNDIQAIQGTAGSGVLTLVDSLMTGGFVIAAMAATISWKLTLIALIPMPFMALLTSYYGSLLHKRFRVAQEAFSSLNDKTQESVSGIKVIKTFGQEKEDIESFRRQSSEVVEKNISVAKVDALFDPTISVIVGTSFLLSVAFGARFVINGDLTIGQLVSFTSYLGLLIWPMLAFGFLFNIMERGRASYDRLTLLLAEKPDIVDAEDGIETVPNVDIDYSISRFAYPEQPAPALEDIRFKLKQGETLGIVGKTGSGKTTLLKLLLREYEGYEGHICLGSSMLEEYRLDALKQAIGYVPQDHFLFSATVAENIAFARPSSTREDIEAAARLANIHDDIVQFTEGYDTVVGERGVSLSGGQKQRISIARALLMDPSILILDDSLSAVDAKTEEAILSALREEREGKTTIITAHRLSAIKHAHLILVMDSGRIAEMGTHQQLMETGGWYSAMYASQQLEELVEQGGQ